LPYVERHEIKPNHALKKKSITNLSALEIQ
jgi:hypothetical protein